jgi:hypothetical protein
MLPTYKALLHGDHLEWEDDVPEHVRAQEGIAVFVTIIGEPGSDEQQRGRRMADALGRLAARGGPGSISDPSDWQRDEREDRPLPGRTR